MKLLSQLLEISSRKNFFATDISHEDGHVMVLVNSGDESSSYYGVNVLFYNDGNIELVTADRISDFEAKNFKKQIIATAERELDKGDLDRIAP
jgi:hypothetical protein